MFENELKRLQYLYCSGLYNNEFYRNKIKDLDAFQSYELFQKMPFMYKQDIRNYGIYERTTAKQDEVFGLFSSSGSTGKKTLYVYTKEDKKVHEMFVNKYFSEIGIRPEDLGGVCAPVDTGVMSHSMMWQYTVMGAGFVNCSQPEPDKIVELIQMAPVTVISTRPEILSSVGIKKEWVEKTRNSEVRMLLPGGGFLSEGRRKYLENIWNASCYNMFGMSEVFGPMAAECKEKNGQHFWDEYLMIEVIDPITLKPVKDGEMGVAVYTTLWKKGFPLIRYWTDDFVIIDRTICKCGNSMPRFFFQGRKSDCFCINGKYLFPKLLEEILIKYGYVQDYEVIWTNGKMDVRIECTSKQHDFPKRMREEIEEYFQTPCRLLVENYGNIGVFKSHGSHFKKM